MTKQVIRIFIIILMIMVCGFKELQAGEFDGAVIRIIVPFAPGGTSDILARLIAPHLGKSTGATVIVENKPGADGYIGADIVAHSKKDGLTLLFSEVSLITSKQSLRDNKLTYDPEKDIMPVSMILFTPYILAVNPTLPVKSADELIKYSKANPGKLVFATSGKGLLNHIAGVQLMKGWGVNWKIIHYKGVSDAIRATISNESQIIVSSITVAKPFVMQNQMRGLAISGSVRSVFLPDIKTWKELRFPVVSSGSWQGVMTTAGSPPKTVNRLNAEISKILSISEVKSRIKELGGEVKTWSPAEFGRWITVNRAKLNKTLSEEGISLD